MLTTFNDKCMQGTNSECLCLHANHTKLASYSDQCSSTLIVVLVCAAAGSLFNLIIVATINWHTVVQHDGIA
jgi:hypothetical protein